MGPTWLNKECPGIATIKVQTNQICCCRQIVATVAEIDNFQFGVTVYQPSYTQLIKEKYSNINKQVLFIYALALEK